MRRNKLRYDLLYIRKMEPWLDLKLIAMSVLIPLRREPKPVSRGGTPTFAPNAKDGGPALESKLPVAPGNLLQQKGPGEPRRASR